MGERTNAEWEEALRGPMADDAIADLRALLLRGLRYALAGRGVTEADLEDFVQEAMIRILQELASFRGESRFTTWAQKVAVRVALTELRRRRWRDVSLDELVTAGDGTEFTLEVLFGKGSEVEQTAMREVMLTTLARVIVEELTDRQRTAMMAVMQGGMPLQEVAERLGTNRNALYKLLHDARLRLQKRMENEGISTQELLALFEAA